MRLVVLAVALAGCYRDVAPAPAPGHRAPAQAAVLADPLAFLPVDADLVSVIEVRRLRASAAWQRVEPRLLGDLRPMLDRFQGTCGFDALGAVRRISVAVRDLDAGRPTALIVLKGPSRELVLACARREQQARPGTLRVDGAFVTVVGSAGSQLVATFADATTLVMLVGGNASLQALDATLRAGVPLRESAAFGTLLATVQISDPLWFVISGNSTLIDRAAMLGLRPHAISGSLDLATGLVARGRVRLDSPDQATQIAQVVQPQLATLASFVEEVTVTADQSDLVLFLRMTQEQVDALLTMAGLVVGPGP